MKTRLVSMILLLTMIFSVTAPGIAAEPAMQKHSKFVTGVTFIWTYDYDEATEIYSWSPAAPGDIYHVPGISDHLGKGARNVKVYTYNGSNFNPGNAEQGAMNTDAYRENYMPYAVSGITFFDVPNQADANGNISYSYQFNLNSTRTYDVAKGLIAGEEQKIRSLMGYVPPVMEKFFADARNGNLDSKVKGELYFMPYVIEWETPAITCSVCGVCNLTDGTKCSESTCDKWAQPGCGCYRPPFVEPPQPVAPPDTEGCNSVIQWSETQSHTWHCGGCQMGGGCPGHNCNHVYTYQTALVVKATVTPSAIKSGYGFTVDVNNEIDSGQISNQGVCGDSKTKQYSNVPKPPAAAEVWLSWKTKNRLGTQPTAVQLERSAYTSTTSKFKCKPNKISEKKERKIYTDVAMKGTGKKPASHSLSIVVSGGGVKGITFCYQLPKSIIINGDMYEDDFTVDRKAK